MRRVLHTLPSGQGTTALMLLENTRGQPGREEAGFGCDWGGALGGSRPCAWGSTSIDGALIMSKRTEAAVGLEFDLRAGTGGGGTLLRYTSGPTIGIPYAGVSSMCVGCSVA